MIHTRFLPIICSQTVPFVLTCCDFIPFTQTNVGLRVIRYVFKQSLAADNFANAVVSLPLGPKRLEAERGLIKIIDYWVMGFALKTKCKKTL